jgi:hypothetical protein
MIKKYWLFFLLLVFSLIGAGEILFVTQKGIGLSPDSAYYVGLARSFGEEKDTLTFLGRSRFLASPGYPLVLSAARIFGLDETKWARYLNVILFALILLLAGLMMRNLITFSFLVIAGSLIALSSIHLLLIHSELWSEPLFIFFTLGGLFSLFFYLKRKQNLFLFIAAGCLGFSAFVRYIGAAGIITGIIAILFLSQETKKRKFSNLIRFTLLSCLPVGTWMMRNFFIAGAEFTGRQIAFHPPSFLSILKSTFFTFWHFFFPLAYFASLNWGLFISSLILLSFCLTRLWMGEKKRNRRISPLTSILLIFILFYFFSLLVSKTFVDARIPFGSRLFSPLYLPVLMLALLLADKVFSLFKKKQKILLGWLIVVVSLFVLFNLRRGINWIKVIRQNPLDYAGERWQQSELIAEIKKLPASTLIYSNGIELIYLLTNRKASLLPKKFCIYSLKKNQNYSLQLSLMEKIIRKKKGIIVFFNTIKSDYLPTSSELEEKLAIIPFKKCADGVIYQAKIEEVLNKKD